ncbi:hypothetical protein V5799_016828 [Amblyomma americanum]|uniref:Uncharacterized protein n=1 Tax=Amblyomma americanum TaxID=6943 RepID=A0AAQ4F3V2_AMBAM
MENHAEVFVIDNSGRVFTRPQNKRSPTATDELCDVTASNVTALYDVQGNVLRLFNAFGFIAVTRPTKTTVYFTVKCFEEGKYSNLLTCGLSEGDSVVLDATKSEGHKASFKAMRVIRINSPPVNSASKPRLAKEELTNEDNRLSNKCGVIHSVMPGYGFIVFGPKKKNCAFFHGSTVDKAVSKGSKNLTEFFTVGDKVNFDARPDDKPSKWVKWKATRVWHAPTPVNSTCNSDADSGDEVFMSEDEDEIQGFLNDESEQESSDVDVEDYPIGCPDWDDLPQRPAHHGDQPREAKSLLDWPAQRKVSGVKGFFVPYTGKTGVVLWLDKGVSVQVVITTMYHMGKQVKSFNELCQDSSERGVEVFFDAVEADDISSSTGLVRSAKQENGLQLPLNKSSSDQPQREAPATGATAPMQSGVRSLSGDVVRSRKKHAATATPSAEPSISVYPNAKGTITQVLDCFATVKVKEVEKTRDVEFSIDCFYRDGIIVMDDLKEVLGVGDEVFLDYMVGDTGHKEVVRCDIVWQGKRPNNAHCLSPDDFAKELDIAPPSTGVTVSVDDLCSGWQQKSLQENNLAAPDQQQLVGEVNTCELEVNTFLPKESRKQAANNIKQSPMPAVSADSPRHVASSTDDETLLRLIRTVVEEYQAKLREELQKCMQTFMERPKVIVVRDAEAQTNREDTAVALSSCGDQTPPFFSPCSSPSKELEPVHMPPPTANSSLMQLGAMSFGAFQPVEALSVPTGLNASPHSDDGSDVPVTDSTSQPLAFLESESTLHSVNASQMAVSVSQPTEGLDTQVVSVENLAVDTALHLTELSHRPCTESEALSSFETRSKDPSCAKVSPSEPAGDGVFVIQAVGSCVPANNSVLELSAALRTEVSCDSPGEHHHDGDTAQPSEALHAPNCEIALVIDKTILEAEGASDRQSTEKSLSSLPEEPDKVPIDASLSQPVNAKGLLVEDGTCSQPPNALDAPCGGGTSVHLVEELGTVQAEEGSSHLRDNGSTEPSDMVHAPDYHIAPLSGDADFKAEGASNKPSSENMSLLPDAADKAPVDTIVLQPVESESSVVEDNSAYSQPGADTSDTICEGTSTHLGEAPGAVGAGEDSLQALHTAFTPETCSMRTESLTQDSEVQLAGNASYGGGTV